MSGELELVAAQAAAYVGFEVSRDLNDVDPNMHHLGNLLNALAAAGFDDLDDHGPKNCTLCAELEGEA